MSSWKLEGHNNGNGNVCNNRDVSPSSSCRRHNPMLPQLLHPITLKFEDVVYSVKLRRTRTICFGPKGAAATTRTVLNGATGIVRPGELLAMLGPSGSGKTTLLTALAGRSPANFSGSITYNGLPFSASIKRKIGFVPQDDLFYSHLTVLETLTFAARLRLPKSLTNLEKIERVEILVSELGLSRCRNVSIGGPLSRGISGGERKRVSIGHEMIMNPSILLLDEPTSGLDSTTAERIAETLRRLAGGGRTVVTTIHQPSARLFAMFDKVVVISEGCPIYSGDAGRVMDYFGSIGYSLAPPGFNFVNPADFLLDLANGISPDTKQDEYQHELPEDHQTAIIKQSLVSSYKTNLYPSLKAEIQAEPQLHSSSFMSAGREDQWTCSWWEQFVLLLRRGLLERKHESYTGLKIFQTMSISVLSGLLWWRSSISNIQDQVALVFFLAVFSSLFPMYNAVFAFPNERPILKKEHSSGMYHLSSYFIARTVSDMPMELLLPAIFVTVPYWMSGLKSSPTTFVLTLFIVLLNVLATQGLGLALGAILMDTKQATCLASVATVAFLMMAGYYIGHIPGFIAWLRYISYNYHTFKLLLGVQYTEDETYDCGGGLHCKVMDFPTVKLVGVDRKWLNVAVLILMLVGFRVIAYVALRIRVG